MSESKNGSNFSAHLFQFLTTMVLILSLVQCHALDQGSKVCANPDVGFLTYQCK